MRAVADGVLDALVMLVDDVVGEIVDVVHLVLLGAADRGRPGHGASGRQRVGTTGASSPFGLPGLIWPLNGATRAII